MPGPPPKPASQRQRRNRKASATTLPANSNVKAPALPKGRKWHAMTREEWRRVWKSPMAAQYLDGDLGGLLVYIVTFDDWATAVTPKDRRELAAELRLQRVAYGITPTDRNRLQWEVERTDEAVERGAKRRRKTAQAAPPAGDPEGVRATLAVLEGGAGA